LFILTISHLIAPLQEAASGLAFEHNLPPDVRSGP
jgi:hypothetical protein